MRIVELKSQSIKIIYKPAVEQIKIGDFISFTDGDITIITQVYKILTSDAADDFNQADLLFVLTKQYNKIKQWQGEFVSANAIISITPKEDIENYIHNQKSPNSFNLSQSAQFKEPFSFDFAKFITPAFIGYEKREDNLNFIKSISKILNNLNKKFLIIDVKGNVNFENSIKIVAGSNIKLPLNSKLLETLCETTLQGISLESRAVIEDVLIELSEYAKTSPLGFVPVSQLISVLNDFYKKSKISPLILLINRLKHYKNMGIFADKKEEVSYINDLQENNKTIILDLSNIPEEWQKIFFKNLIEPDEKIEKDFYINIFSDENIYDNKTFNYLLFKAINHGIKPIISVNYRNLSFDNIFDFCNNAFLFKTNNALKKRTVLTDILQSLPPNVFITKGKLSNGLLLPLIINEQEEEILDYIEQEISETNNLEEIKEDVSPKYFEKMNNALEEKPKTIFKNPPEFITPPSYHAPESNNIDDIEAAEPSIELEQPSTSPETEEQTVEQKPIENILEVENVTIADEEEPSFQQEETINIQEINQETPQQETKSEPINISIPQEEPIIEENILSDENINIEEVSDNEITNDEEILELVESTDSNDTLEFEEVSSEPELENVDIDDLDFLNETPSNDIQENNNDDDLLDLIDNKEQVQLDDSLEDIELENDDFEEITQEENFPQEEDFPQEEELPQQNLSKIPVYNAESYSNKSNQANKEFDFKEGDIIKHNKYGTGTIKKITRHADKILCHINFDTCGRRLLDPEISEIEKIG